MPESILGTTSKGLVGLSLPGLVPRAHGAACATSNGQSLSGRGLVLPLSRERVGHRDSEQC